MEKKNSDTKIDELDEQPAWPYEVWVDELCVTCTHDEELAMTSYLKEIQKLLALSINPDVDSDISVSYVNRVQGRVLYLNRGQSPLFEETTIPTIKKDKPDEPTKH